MTLILTLLGQGWEQTFGGLGYEIGSVKQTNMRISLLDQPLVHLQVVISI